jgi:hypothetical protein
MKPPDIAGIILPAIQKTATCWIALAIKETYQKASGAFWSSKAQNKIRYRSG